jgi:ABC-type oligopeptide transport system substrate-binding subunit
MKRILTTLTAALTLAALLTGCATQTSTTTTSTNGVVTVVTTDKSDPLLTKIVIQRTKGTGIDFDLLGIASYVSPVKFKVGNFDVTTMTIPTCASNKWTAALNSTAHANASLIEIAGDDNISTTTNLPDQAFIGPNVQTLNPIVQNANLPAVSVATNAVAK